MKSQSVAGLRKRYRREWLLVAVDRLDPRTQEPLMGRVLAHSPLRTDLEPRFITAKGLTYLVYSETRLPHGYAVAFLRA